MRVAVVLLVMGALSGCGEGTPTPQASPSATPPSEFQARVVAMADGARNGVFIRAIRDSGMECQGVTESSRRADSATGEPVYVAKCTSGATYSIVLARDSTAKVTGAIAR